ncbi:MAG TPA: TerB family tellurite resistance protein [Polyangiaceae bacterium]
MSVRELTESEQVVLLALVGLMARADGSVSEPEMDVLDELRDGIGPERFAGVRDAAAGYDGAEAILQAAAKIERAEARDTIFQILVAMAAPDSIAENEAELFRRLGKLWGLDASFA